MNDPQVYIVSVWHSTGASPGLRATARPVEDAEARSFTTADELGHYLAKAADEQAPEPASVENHTAGEPKPPQERT